MKPFIKYLLLFLLLCDGIHATAQLIRDNADEYYDEAVKQAKLRNYNRALDYGRKALDRRPNFLDMELLMGRIYMITKAYDSARIHIKNVITQDPRYRDAYMYAINIEMTTNKLEEALCFADDALYFFPADKELMLKKLSILELTRRIPASERLADHALDRYPTDSKVILAYVDHKLTLGRYYLSRGNMLLARYHFENALAVDPTNRDALQALYNLEIRSGNYQNALDKVNYALLKSPNSYELLMTKLGLLQEMKRYSEALDVLTQLFKYYPNDIKARSLEQDLRMEAAHYFLGQDPLTQYESVLEKYPGNREALNAVIGIHTERGQYREAMAWLNKGLKNDPNDINLLGSKLDLLEADRKFTEGAAIAERLYRRDPSFTVRNRLIDLKIASGKEYQRDQMYDTALMQFQRALELSPTNYDALDAIASIQIAQKNYDEALSTLDEMTKLFPNDEKSLLKKSSVLEQAGRTEDAADVSARLLARNPVNRKYNAIYVEQRLAVGRQFMKDGEFDLARPQLKLVLAADSTNLDAVNYLIGLEDTTRHFDSALVYANIGLKFHPNDRDLLLKKSGLLEQSGRYQEAYTITRELSERYPFNIRFRQAYIDDILASGRSYARNNIYDTALFEYRKALDIAPRDSNVLQASIALLMARGLYDTSLVLIDRGINAYPNSEFFRQRRAVVLESLQRYGEAAEVADAVAKLNPTPKNIDYANYLRNLSLRREFGLFFLNTRFDDGSRPSNIATLEYRQFKRWGSWATRLNYAGRAQGTGLQGDVEATYYHDSINSSYALITASDGLVFPRVRLGYSLIHNFNVNLINRDKTREWTGEVGFRYVNSASASSISVVTSAEKQWKEFYTNLRAYFILQNGNYYNSFNLNARYYIRDEEFIRFNFGLGTSPDDISRNITPTAFQFITKNIGAGYQKTFNYRNIFGINATWINQKISATDFRNQYDIYVSYQRRF